METMRADAPSRPAVVGIASPAVGQRRPEPGPTGVVTTFTVAVKAN